MPIPPDLIGEVDPVAAVLAVTSAVLIAAGTVRALTPDGGIHAPKKRGRHRA